MHPSDALAVIGRIMDEYRWSWKDQVLLQEAVASLRKAIMDERKDVVKAE